MNTKHIIFPLLLLMLSACALLKGKKEIQEIKLEYPTDAKINYGYTFPIKTYVVYSNGKKKEITGKKELTISAEGATYSNGKLKIGGYPENLRSDTIKLTAVYTVNDKTYEKKMTLPFNYNGDLVVAFNGKAGIDGESGKNKGTPVILRNGKNGEDGGEGGVGENGADLTVNIWKETDKERYRVKVSNLVTQKTYQYTYQPNGFGIRFEVNGGKGGNGGDGGDGGNGKDGLINEKKNKDPGDGGNGGNGGIGGTGGNGGTVFVFIHPNAAELENKIAIYNFGGTGGNAGQAGDAGEGGDPAEGQDLVPDGVAGADGVVGQSGETGAPYQIIVEDFDIED